MNSKKRRDFSSALFPFCWVGSSGDTGERRVELNEEREWGRGGGGESREIFQEKLIENSREKRLRVYLLPLSLSLSLTSPSPLPSLYGIALFSSPRLLPCEEHCFFL